MGLPLSLAGTGAVLGFPEQKLKEGKELIKYFCIPCVSTKTNGFSNTDVAAVCPKRGTDVAQPRQTGGTRNLPKHAPEKWANAWVDLSGNIGTPIFSRTSVTEW